MPRYWFRQKTFGFGSTPNTWQGWLATIVSLLLLTGIVMSAAFIRDNGLRPLWLIGGALVVMVPFGWLCWRKTEGGWRWRSGG